MNMKLAGICELLRNTEGRDKCCKFIQYQSRMYMHLLTNPWPVGSDRFRQLFSKEKLLQNQESSIYGKFDA